MKSKTDPIHLGWRAPSNIAIVKYWGKFAGQIPANPSISFSLSSCHTDTKLTCLHKQSTHDFPEISVYYEGKIKMEFLPKIESFIKKILPEMPWLTQYKLEIETKNTFPHSSGIASSASGMAALALCLTELEENELGKPHVDFFQRASYLARIGSGSAARSVYGGFTQWGIDALSGSSDTFAIPISESEIHPVFLNLRDYILLIHQGEKTTSSTAGHSLMHGHPFAESRFTQAKLQVESLRQILKTGEVMDFIQLMENEALTLHALMMSSNPSYILMKPNTLAAIEAIRQFRKDNRVEVGFTLDAGANVHLIFTESAEQQVKSFVNETLVNYCEGGAYICDQLGDGPHKL